MVPSLLLLFCESSVSVKKILIEEKDELGGKMRAKFVELREKTYSYLKDDCSEDKKAKKKKNIL